MDTINVVQLYAVKHNPFAYFASIQEGSDRDSSLANIVGFEGPNGLFADLKSGNVPDFAFIVPNQCDDQHGRANGDAFCAFDYGMNNSGYTYGTQVGLSYSLLKSMEAGFGLPCLNHACGSDVQVMSDLFGGQW